MHSIRKAACRHIRHIRYHHRPPFNAPVCEQRVQRRPYCHTVRKQNRTDFSSAVSTKAESHQGLFGRHYEKDQKKSLKKNSSKKTKKKKKHGRHYDLKKFMAKLVIVGIIIWAILKYVFGVMILYGNYMFPSVRDGDLVISYKLQSPIINDLVMYRHNGELRVGRVVGKENSIVRYNSETQTYSINGITPSEEIFYTTVKNDDADIEYPYTIPSGSVYVLNDFRSEMTDSRTYEAVPLSDVEGVVVFVIRRRGF